MISSVSILELPQLSHIISITTLQVSLYNTLNFIMVYNEDVSHQLW